MGRYLICDDTVTDILKIGECKMFFRGVSELKLVREGINPAILSCLENKIQNINQLGKEIAPEKIGMADFHEPRFS